MSDLVNTFNATGTGKIGTFLHFNVSLSHKYKITAYGAQGGTDSGGNGQPGGKGAKISAEFDLEKGQVLKILVGQKGGDGDGIGGGGGASHVAIDNGDDTYIPLVSAAGGSGGGYFEGNPGRGLPLALESESQGGAGSGGGMSAGFYGNAQYTGQLNETAKSFVNGGAGSSGDGGGGDGGFGGGAGSESDVSGVDSDDDGGAGGGYTGTNGANNGVGEGGISFCRVQDGTLIAEAGIKEGDGLVIIEIKVNKKIRGTVFGVNGPTEKEVYIYSRNTGTLLGKGLSNATTGDFDIPVGLEPTDLAMAVVVDKTENKNALIYDQIVGEDL